MGFGLSFGKKKQSSSGTSTVDKTTDLTGTQNTNTTSQGTTSTATSGTQATTTQQNQTGSTAQQQTGTTSGSTKGVVTTLGQDIQDALSSKVKEVLGAGVSGDSLQSLSDAVGGRATSFDGNAFVSAIMGNARNRGEQTLQEQQSAFNSGVGGTAGTNSMAALLASRGRNDLESSLAATEAQARAQAEGITNDNLKTGAGVAQGITSIATALGDTLKGATSTSDTTNLMQEISNLLGSSAQSTTGSENTATSQTSKTDQLLQEIANVLTSQQQKEVGTETQKMKGKSGGFGLSLGF